MSSSSFLDNPVLKVSRPVAACSKCRTAKVKCDGKLPACTACEKSGKASSCSGATDEFAKGKERSYVASLEGYCERLEKRLREIRRRKQMLALTSGDYMPESSITSISMDNQDASAHRKEVSDIDDLVGDFGFLSVNATSRDFRGITSTVSFAQLLLTVASAEPLPRFSSKALHPRHEATGLIQHYFDNIFIQLPFFTETTFWTSVDAVYQDGGRFAKPFDHWIVRMVLAIASASMSNGTLNHSTQRAMSLVSSALDYAEDVLRPGSMVGIQAILLLAQYSMLDPEHFRQRFLVGFAARVMVDLGLHQDPPVEVFTDQDRLDKRRRLFYCIYSLDRLVSTASGYAFSFSDDSVNVLFPRLPATPIPSSLTHGNHVFLKDLEPAIHLFKIRRILSSGYQEMYFSGHHASPQPLVLTWTLCANARDWFDKAPKHPPSYFPLLYRLELLYSTIVFLSPSHRDPVICDFKKVLLFDRCIDYVSQLHQVVENLNGLPFVTYVDIQRVYQVGQRFVEILNQSYDLLLSNSVPEPPPVPPGTPEPPYLAAEDRINCVARAIRCLTYTRDILQYGFKRWNMRQLLHDFTRDSTAIKQRLMQRQEPYSTGYGVPGPPYVPVGGIGLPSANGYQAFDPYVDGEMY
ncbi:hypothetical protein VTN77DRAFT_9107 [Rasamsonia byssochlamydoides]|uniref:uncharacterized protein n=1 Tax=Rasamsonia byssochlamydoides TaxID=89139 RepID=UPI0037443488